MFRNAATIMIITEKRKIARILVVLCILGAIAWLSIRVVAGFKSNAKALAEDLPSVYAISNEDSTLITPHYRKKLKVIEVRRSKVRDSIMILSLEEKYLIILQKIKLTNTFSLVKDFHLEKESTDRSTMVSYSIIDLGTFSYQYKAGSIESVSNIFLTLSGNDIKTLSENDHVVSYSLEAKSVALRFGIQNAIDTYIIIKEGFMTKPMPMNIMLLQKGNSIYYIILCAKEGRKLAKPYAIQEIVNVTL